MTEALFRGGIFRVRGYQLQIPGNRRKNSQSGVQSQCLLRLTDEEFSRIIAMIRSGEESIGCLPVECAEILISETMKRGDMNAANELYALYEMGGGCG